MSALDEQIQLFPTPPVTREPDLRELTPGQRERHWLSTGRHPATRMALHVDAAPVTEPGQKAEGLRCRDCAHLTRKKWGDKTFFKCPETPFIYDMRGWWPACHGFKAVDDADS